MGKLVKLSDRAYEKLSDKAGKMQVEMKRPVSMSEAVEKLVEKSDKPKLSDFAGTWKMTKREKKKFYEELDEIWATWKLE